MITNPDTPYVGDYKNPPQRVAMFMLQRVSCFCQSKALHSVTYDSDCPL